MIYIIWKILPFRNGKENLQVKKSICKENADFKSKIACYHFFKNKKQWTKKKYLIKLGHAYLSYKHISSKVYIPNYFQDINYDDFRRFLDAFLDCETPEELTRHLFVSFLKPQHQIGQHGKVLNQMAAVSSHAACAAVTAYSKGLCTIVMFKKKI